MRCFLLLILWWSGVRSQNTTYIIHNQAEAKSLASASPTIVGSILIASNYSGPLSLDGFLNITNAVATQDFSSLTTVTSPSLQYCGFLSFQNTQTLVSLNFSGLISLGALSFLQVRNLTSFTMSDSYLGLPNLGLLIYDTGLTNTDTIKAKYLGSVDIEYNKFMTNVTLPRAVQIATMKIISNGDVTHILMPLLQKVDDTGGLFISGFTSFEAPVLSELNDLVLFSLSGSNVTLPLLSQVNGILITGALSNFSAPLLQSTAAIDINYLYSDSSQSTVFNGFPSLRTAGSIYLAGKFRSVILPRLVSVSGSFTIYADPSVDCSVFDNLKAKNQIIGQYICNGTHSLTNVTSSSTSGTTFTSPTQIYTSSSMTSDSSGLSTGAKTGIGASVGGAVLIGLVIGTWCLWLKRRRRRNRQAALPNAPLPELSSSAYRDAAELKGVDDPIEMPMSDQHREAVEMDATPYNDVKSQMSTKVADSSMVK